jgi:tetratricopeptide (TPR) repeat protein
LAARWADRDASLAAKVETLLETMRDGLYLILLDNLEDTLTEEGAIAEEGLRLFVERCLTQPDGVRLVVTSREEVQLASAALRGARSIPLREGLPEDEAVALLHDLDPQGTLGLRDAPEDDLRRAARLTRGIPRALEILAGILHEDPTASLPKLLADETAIGTEVVERLVAAGYRRLEDDKRRIMEALAVFDRPVDETAIVYLLHPWFPGLDAQASLRRLTSSYFVSASRATGEYSLHPLDREYAYRQLHGDEGADAYNQCKLELRAADFYASIRKPESKWKTIDDLAPQLAEFGHRVRAGDYDSACQVLEPIDYDYLYVWGHYARLVELREQLLGRLTDPRSQAVNLDRLGLSYYFLGQVERAIELYEQTLVVTREIGDRRREGAALGKLGGAYHDLGQVERAIEFYEKALEISREIGDHRREGVAFGNLGLAYYDLGQVEQAIEFYEKALEISCEIGDRRREGVALGNLGLAYYDLGQVERAIKSYEKALEISRQMGDRRGESHRLGNLGYAYCFLGQVQRAIEFHEEALAIACEIGHRRGESYQLLLLSRGLLTIGKLSEAQQRCAEALVLDVPETSYQAALVLGIVLLHQHDPTAEEIFADAAARCQALLDKTAGLYQARYALAAALVGSAVCDPHWAQENERAGLLAPALEEYRRALENCAAPGVVRDALRDLEMIRAAGVDGLEPVFELLQYSDEV